MCVCVQVFGYLDTAMKEIGFTHGDLNCANVMEHRGDADVYLPKGFAEKGDKNQLFNLPGLAPPHISMQAAGRDLSSVYANIAQPHSSGQTYGCDSSSGFARSGTTYNSVQADGHDSLSVCKDP